VAAAALTLGARPQPGSTRLAALARGGQAQPGSTRLAALARGGHLRPWSTHDSPTRHRLPPVDYLEVRDVLLDVEGEQRHIEQLAQRGAPEASTRARAAWSASRLT
jgi:hypothetical protein